MLCRHAVIGMLLLAALAALAAPTPTVLRVVDLRWIAGQPELETWLGSLQGTLNRGEGKAAVYLIRDDADAALADALQRMYGLTRETLTPGALLEAARPALTGQALYDPAKPWTRNLALTLAALAPGAVVATDHDLGLPTAHDLRPRADRLDAYRGLIEQYAAKADPSTVVLAAERGHLLADLVAARRTLALDLSPRRHDDVALLLELFNRYPQGVQMIGGSAADTGPLAALYPGGALAHTPACDTANLSCLARFPATRPLLQWRAEAEIALGKELLVLVYETGGSLDAVNRHLLPLLDDPALSEMPVGIEVPAGLLELAPGIYQHMLARQRDTAIELIAAPTAPALPKRVAEMDLAGVSIAGENGAWPSLEATLRAAAGPWTGAFLCPGPAGMPAWAADPQPRLAHLSLLMAARRVRTPAELRQAVAALKGPVQVLYLDPDGLPPATVAAMLKEITYARSLATPSQAFRAAREFAAVVPFLLAQQVRNPQRRKPTLQVAVPATPNAAPDPAAAIPVTVRIRGDAGVLVARAIYADATGRIGAIDLRDAGNGAWTGTLPPLLIGGAASVRARVVEQGGFGITLTEPLALKLPIVDSDNDTLDDALELVRGSNPHSQDSDGDGLPDPLDDRPIAADRAIAAYCAPVRPPADAAFLTEAGDSRADAGGRTLPARAAITYRLPVKDLPAGQAVLRLVTAGPGTLTVNGGDALALAAVGDDELITDLPLARVKPAPVLTITLAAGAAPLRVVSLRLLTNPEGPYLQSLRLFPANPPANTPITVRAIVYDPDGVAAVRLRYGNTAATKETLELKPVAEAGGVVFEGVIPAQPFYGGTLVYGVTATDGKGHTMASPYRVTTVGRTRKFSVALFGGRDLYGDWAPSPLWGGRGRELAQGIATDSWTKAALRPGNYTAWLLAAPRVRGVGVTIDRPGDLATRTKRLLAAEVRAGAADGWVKLGAFAIPDESARLDINVFPTGGENGYCAYGALVLTQDDQFTPPLAHAAIDWYNSVTVTGARDGQTITGGKITLDVQLTGNIDAVRVTADYVRGGAISDLTTHVFEKDADGRYVLYTGALRPGIYAIKAAGQRITNERGRPTAQTILEAKLEVIIPPR